MTFVSCDRNMVEDEIIATNRPTKSNDFKIYFDSKENIEKKEFSQALLSSLSQSLMLREILKTEALKEFDNDREVLFVLIKDLSLENGTVFDLMASNIGGEQKLLEIISNAPDLTILVPTLPNDSFSAENWDTSKVPAVGIRLDNSNNVPVLLETGEQEVLASDIVPGFPIIVVKNNERLIGVSNPLFKETDTNIVYQENGIMLRFSDEIFDVKVKPKSHIYRTTRHVDPKLEMIYNLNKDLEEKDRGWQRDYIYYGIHSGNPNGPFLYNYNEHITSFGPDGDPFGAYSAISDQVDEAKLNPVIGLGNNSSWTEGYYEFLIKVVVNSTQGGGTEIIKRLNIKPSDLFDLKYKEQTMRFGPFTKKFFILETIANKRIFPDTKVIAWNLGGKSTEFNVIIEEIDVTTTTTYTDNVTAKFASNASADFKIGIKLGGSAETTQSNTVTRTYTQGNDQLGNSFVNFGEDIIVGELNSNSPIFGGTRWKINDYTTGTIRFSFEPRHQ